MTKEHLVSVGIVTRNRPELLAMTLMSLGQQMPRTLIGEVIVVDNGFGAPVMANQLVQFATQFLRMQEIEVIVVSKSRSKDTGLLSGRRVCLDMAQCELFLCGDDDIIYEPTFFDLLSTELKAHSEIPLAVGVVQDSSNHRNVVPDDNDYSFAFDAKTWTGWAANRQKVTQIRSSASDAVSGPAMLYRTLVARECGIFDTDEFTPTGIGDDLLAQHRIMQAGHKMIVCFGANAMHMPTGKSNWYNLGGDLVLQMFQKSEGSK